MKLISFSLYGKSDKYIRGMDENIKLQKVHYPDWKVIIYHDDSINKRKLEYYENQGVMLRNMEGSGILAGSWRFLALDENCERFICRDADSRISNREVLAVKEWQKEKTWVHIMRDHPHHGYAILAGMWGLRTEPIKQAWSTITMKDKIIEYQGGKISKNTDKNTWWLKDQDFLKDVIYRQFVGPQTSTIHNPRDFMNRVNWDCETWAKDFPEPINAEKNFVGEIFIFDESGNEQREYQYKER